MSGEVVTQAIGATRGNRGDANDYAAECSRCGGELLLQVFDGGAVVMAEGPRAGQSVVYCDSCGVGGTAMIPEDIRRLMRKGHGSGNPFVTPARKAVRS